MSSAAPDGAAAPADVVVRTAELCRTYAAKSAPVHALCDVSLEIRRGEKIALLGRSGSGKSSLLNVLGGLDRPTSGRVEVAGLDLTKLGARQLSHYRSTTVGMIFQSFHLVASQTALQNVELPMVFTGRPPRDRRAAALRALEAVGLAGRVHHRQGELSGGERQRVAIARALVNGPRLLLADEPTGNLDTLTAETILKILDENCRRGGVTLVLVTHDEELARRHVDRVLRLAGRTAAPLTTGRIPVRLSDVLRLALTALVQQKVRTVLTTLGVAVGSLVLLLSLSIGVGLQEAVSNELHRHDELRKIEVRPGYGKVEEHIPPEELAVRGDMNDAKRRRLHDRLVQAWIARHGYPPTTPLTTDRLAEIRGWPHVASVTPLYTEWGRVSLDGKGQDVETVSATAGRERRMRTRLVAGSWFTADDERSVVVSEYLLYEWGMASDAEVRTAVGRKLRVEHPTGASRPMMLLSLFNVDLSMVGPEQEKIARKVLQNLPAVVDKLGLDPDEVERLRNMLHGPNPAAAPEPEQTISEELTIVGVVRGPEKDDPPPESLVDRFRPDADVFLPVGTAEELYFRDPHHAERGLDFADVTVDSEAHVQEVVDRVEATGLGQYSLVDFAQRVWTNVTLLTSAIIVLALTALIVAALGITNTLVMSVLERRHEIGVMKAVGARDGHVLALFLVEGAWIGLLGGCLGLLFGWLASFPAEAFAMSLVQRQGELHPDQPLFAFPLWLILGVPLFAVLITTLAALYPARRAARVNPIEALRSE